MRLAVVVGLVGVLGIWGCGTGSEPAANERSGGQAEGAGGTALATGGVSSGGAVASGGSADMPSSCTVGQTTTEAGCANCAPGGYCPGGDESMVTCGEVDFDHDLRSTTPCKPATECAPGSSVLAELTPTSNRICGACGDACDPVGPPVAACLWWEQELHAGEACSKAVQITTSANHTCALDDAGAVTC